MRWLLADPGAGQIVNDLPELLSFHGGRDDTTVNCFHAWGVSRGIASSISEGSVVEPSKRQREG